ncbi:pentapeptide repeat-containing protein [Methylophaga sp.]|uniref:pentapeptide repeat-containing protein n=1 Tax=Methylophaga sp. TaxID=2024840 RepID=UPI003F6A1BBA
MKPKHGQWYIREDGDVSGPFNGSVITNHLIVGRLSMQDEVSADKQHWVPLEEQTELHPFLSDEEKAKRHMDERTGLDRRQQQTKPPPEAKQRRGERREDEPDIELERRELRRTLMQKYSERHEHMFWPLLLTFSILMGMTLLAVFYPTAIPVPLPNCAAPAAPEVNWNNCLKPNSQLNGVDLTSAQLRNSDLTGVQLMNATLTGADIAYTDLRFANLSYSDLQKAILLGANLTQTDFSNADLSQADLSYADLSNANLANAKLEGVRFDHAIWINGQICAPDSIGECRPLAE